MKEKPFYNLDKYNDFYPAQNYTKRKNEEEKSRRNIIKYYYCPSREAYLYPLIFIGLFSYFASMFYYTSLFWKHSFSILAVINALLVFFPLRESTDICFDYRFICSFIFIVVTGYISLLIPVILLILFICLDVAGLGARIYIEQEGLIYKCPRFWLEEFHVVESLFEIKIYHIGRYIFFLSGATIFDLPNGYKRKIESVAFVKSLEKQLHNIEHPKKN